MLISESKLRRIIREEATAALGGTKSSDGSVRERPLQFTQSWNRVHDTLGRVGTTLGSDGGDEAELTNQKMGTATSNWPQVYKKGKSAPLSAALARTISNVGESSPDGLVRAIIATITTGRSYTGEASGFAFATPYDSALGIEGGYAPQRVPPIIKSAVGNARQFIDDVKRCISFDVGDTAAPTPSPAPTPAPTPRPTPPRPNPLVEKVKKFQRLIEMPPKEQDGIWGDKTTTAFKNFLVSNLGMTDKDLVGATLDQATKSWKTAGPSITALLGSPAKFTGDIDGAIKFIETIRTTVKTALAEYRARRLRRLDRY